MKTLKNKLKYILTPLIISFSLFYNFTSPALSLPLATAITNNTTVNIVQDNNNQGLPNHFRQSSDKINEPINYTGLESLNISGSAQFSKSGLSLIKEKLNTISPVIVVDLREESHGFVNGIPISWKSNSNNANEGLSKEAICKDETKKLNNLKINSPLPLSNNGTIIVKTVLSEKSLSEKEYFLYERIPVTDGGLPNSNTVNNFMAFVQNIPEDSYLHFHCKAGIGRTTTFMILYDIMKNYNAVPLNEIIIRQVKLAKLNHNQYNDFTSGRRLDFFTKFYNQCKDGNLD